MSRNFNFIGCKNVPVVAPREGRVSRNDENGVINPQMTVAPREGRVSRNLMKRGVSMPRKVAPREGRVSRNLVRLLVMF